MARIVDYAAIPKYNFRHIGDGVTLGHGLFLKPAPYLPIVDYSDQNKIGVVIKKGTFVTFDEFGYIVPAKKASSTLSYSNIDAEFGVYDIDSFTDNLNSDSKVSGAKTSTKTLGPDGNIKSFYPIGVAMYDMYQFTGDPWFKPQDRVALIQDGLVLMALDDAHASVNYKPGALLVLDDDGFPVPLEDFSVDTTANKADVEPMHYIVGRLVKVLDLANKKDAAWKNALDMVVVPDIVQPYVAGQHTEGVSDGFDPNTKKGLLIQLNMF